MATRFYLRSTTTNVGGYVRTEKSTTLPVGTFDDSGNAVQDLSRTKGSAETTRSNASLAQTGQQSQFMGKHISEALVGAGSLSAQTWTVAVVATEGAAFANAFLRVVLYTLQSGDTVGTLIYDGDADLGVEFDGTGEVLTFSGAAVGTVADTDRLCLELWVVAAQGMGTAYTNTIAYDGATDVVDATTTDSASYVETPQNIFPPTLTGATMADSGRDWATPYQEVSLTFSEAMEKSGGTPYGVGDTIPGLTIGPSGTEGAVTYRSGDSTTGWVVRRAALAKNGDSWVVDYAQSTGEIVGDGGGTELANTADFAVTNNLTKRIRETLKDDAGSAITTAVDILLLDAIPRDSDDANWGAILQRNANVTPSTGLIDITAPGALVVGDPAYMVVFNPREDATGGATSYARTAAAVVTVT